MSDHYLIHFNCELRYDIPDALARCLAILAEGGIPTEADTEGLPRIVGSYLRSSGPPGDGVYLFYRRVPLRRTAEGQFEDDLSRPDRISYQLRMARTFHDDEYYNGGLYWPYWLYQFAKIEGPIATMQQINGMDIPSVISKFGDRLIETSFDYNPGGFDRNGRAPPEADTPVVISRQTEISLSETLEQISMWADQE